VEHWNNGHEKRKTGYPTRNIESAFFDDAHQASIFGFPAKIIHQKKKINEIICVF
jgi:hypothetical protein